ncbi:unnamed protein product [Parascedosporium putredinis]|uniref:Uncharacterized protein n=1 Tax=Parascedosporium putredinis TaxID=1442378 RepID=A0A9P1H8N8_9PEZI|nr:unnamed protein product [Parascedosporium putredinis]CAI8002577.1 unnamed protein product [Parascedosporium putredinis]
MPVAQYLEDQPGESKQRRRSIVTTISTLREICCGRGAAVFPPTQEFAAAARAISPTPVEHHTPLASLALTFRGFFDLGELGLGVGCQSLAGWVFKVRNIPTASAVAVELVRARQVSVKHKFGCYKFVRGCARESLLRNGSVTIITGWASGGCCGC